MMSRMMTRAWLARLLYKEMLRFWKVGFQTVGAPVLTAVLYLMVFGHVLEDHVKVYGTVSYTAFLVPGPGDDERAAERVRQQLVVDHPEQDHGQPGVRAAHAAVALGLVLRLCGLVGRARAGGGRWACSLVTLVLRRRRFVGAAVDRWCSRFLGAAHAGHAGPDRRPVGRKVRPDGGVPELPHHADDLSVGRVLFDPFAAAVLADA